MSTGKQQSLDFLFWRKTGQPFYDWLNQQKGSVREIADRLLQEFGIKVSHTVIHRRLRMMGKTPRTGWR